MKIFQLDLFCSAFYFNLDGQNYKKGTVQGIVLSLASITLVISYFIYLLYQYFNNLIEPQFRSQSFITDMRKEIQLDEDLVGFQYYYNSSLTINQYQDIQNKTYLVFYAYFYYYDPLSNINQIINLDVKQCTHPQLKGQNCIDFSQIRNYTLVLDNVNNIFSQLYINVYGCLDIDNVKTAIPDNCGTQSEIDAIINGSASGVSLQLQTQQYNTTSKQIQTNYRYLYTYSQSNQYIINTFKTQIQQTEVKQGLIIQELSTFQSPIYYDQTMFSFDRNFSLQQGVGPYNQITISMDEYVQFVCVQYATITQILALVNSVATVIMICRVLGIYVSQRIIKEDFFILIMRNLFLEKCQQILQNNNQSPQAFQLCCQTQRKEGEGKNYLEQDLEVEELADNISEYQNKKEITLPDFQSKCFKKRSKQIFDESSSSQSKQKQKFDEDFQLKDEIKITSSFISLKNQNQASNNKNITNCSKTDKIDPISQNISPMIKQMSNSGIFDKQKSQFVAQQKIFQNQINSQSNNLKVDLKCLSDQSRKNLVEHISSKLQIMQSSSMKKSIQNAIFNFKCFKSKFLQSKGIRQRHIDKINQEVQRNLNVNEFFKDMIFLKKAVCMLLSLDQIAAIQLVGLTDNFINLDLYSTDSKVNYECKIFQIIFEIQIPNYFQIEDKAKLNHFEKQFSILQSEQLQLHYIEKFLNRCQQASYLSEADHRIMSSILAKSQ